MKYLAIILLSLTLILSFSGGLVYALDQGENIPGQFKIENPTNIGSVQDLLKLLLNLAVQIGVPILVIAIIYVGFLFVQAQGNETKLADAKAAFFWTIIGAAIVLGAFVISTAIQNTVDQLEATSLIPVAHADYLEDIEENPLGTGWPSGDWGDEWTSGQGDTFGSLVNRVVNGIFDPLVGLIIGLALLYFLWGLSKFVLNSGDESALKEAKQMMIWGVIALFVMVSVWGLVSILTGTFFAGGLPTEAPLPTFQ